jgi:transposase-like protein
MRSTLVRSRKRCCPMCDNRGFARIGYDFFRQPIFRCHNCGHEWTKERGPLNGTDARARQLTETPDAE